MTLFTHIYSVQLSLVLYQSLLHTSARLGLFIPLPSSCNLPKSNLQIWAATLCPSNMFLQHRRGSKFLYVSDPLSRTTSLFFVHPAYLGILDLLLYFLPSPLRDPVSLPALYSPQLLRLPSQRHGSPQKKLLHSLQSLIPRLQPLYC